MVKSIKKLGSTLFPFIAGIFYRVMARAVEWSQEQGDTGRPPVLRSTESSFVADDDHQFQLLKAGNMIMVFKCNY